MRISGRVLVRVLLIAVIIVLVWMRYWPLIHRSRMASTTMKVVPVGPTSDLNQPGGGLAPDKAYEVYSSLYQAPSNDPLVFAEESATDIPQVGGNCLKPSTPEEQQMATAFTDANRQSHTWQPEKFHIPQGHRVLPTGELSDALTCLHTHGRDAVRCAPYKDLTHVRLLGMPGFDKAGDKALVSVIKKCGGVCGSGGIFAVEKKGSTWQRSETTDFTRDCSWMY